MPISHLRRSLLLAGASLVLGACASGPDEGMPADDVQTHLADLPVHVLMVEGFVGVHRALEPRLLVPTQPHVESGSGTVPAVATALARHLQQGASADVVVAPAAVMAQLRAQGLVQAGSLVNLVRSPLVLVVQAGRSVPAIRSAEALRALLLQAPSFAYPATDGSDFVEQQLLPKLGIKDAVLAKSIKAFGPQVAALVARGDAQLGLQSASELTGATGITVVGTLPAPFGYASTYTAGIATHAHSLGGAQALVRFYQREAAAHDWQGTGWEVVAQPVER